MIIFPPFYFQKLLREEMMYVLITNRKITAYATGHALDQWLPVIDLIVKESGIMHVWKWHVHQKVHGFGRHV